jgi:hypothetical protein
METRLEKRRRKVTRLLGYMLDEKNDEKILQCYRIFNLINEQYQQIINKRKFQLNLIYKNGKTN